ncbi:MAG: histidine phosphatase family protein [Anaerolineales bacterium]|jgi:probable phosphoglycerate mutase
MAIILLIRHGENDFTGKRLIGRQPGIGLNEKGRQQAMALAEWLLDAPIKAIYSSPLERAVQTAQPLAHLKNLDVKINPALIEVDYGECQGKTFKQLHRTKLWKAIHANPAGAVFPGGEALAGVQERVVRELQALAATFEPVDVIACFSHADVIRLAVAYFLRMPLGEFQRLSISTGSITVLYLNSDKARVTHINLVGRLEWPNQSSQSSR